MRKFYLLFLMTLFSLFAGAEDWVSLGKVKFTEGTYTYRGCGSSTSTTQQEFIVELQQDLDATARYRLVDPYKDFVGSYSNDSYDSTEPHYMVIDAHDANHVYFETFETGYTGRDGLISITSQAYYAWQNPENGWTDLTYDQFVTQHGSSYHFGTLENNTITFPGYHIDSQGNNSTSYMGTTGRNTMSFNYYCGYDDTIISLDIIEDDTPAEVPDFSFSPESGTTLEDGELSTVTLTCAAGINLTEFGELEFAITKDGKATDYTLFCCPFYETDCEGESGAYTKLVFVVKDDGNDSSITDPGEYVITIDVGAIKFTNGTTNDEEITLTYIIEEPEPEPIVVGSIVYDEAGVAYEVTDLDASTVSVYQQGAEGVNGLTTGDIVIPESFTYQDVTYYVTGMVYESFYNANITSLTLPGTITTWSDSVSGEGHNATSGYTIYDCTLLKTVTFGEGITSIPANCIVFDSGTTTALTTIYLPSTVTSIANKAFSRVTALTDIYCEALTAPTVANNQMFNGMGNTQAVTVHIYCAAKKSFSSTSGWTLTANPVMTLETIDDCPDLTYTLSPSEEEQEQLSEFTLTYNVNIEEANISAENCYVSYVVDKETKTVSFSYEYIKDGDDITGLTLTLTEPITDNGTYTFHLAADAITFVDGRGNEEITFEYTIDNKTVTFETITLDEAITLEAGAEGYYSYTAESDGTLTFSESGVTVSCYSDEEMTVQLTLTEADGKYTLEITEGATYYFHLTTDSSAGTITFSLEEEEEEPVEVTIGDIIYDENGVAYQVIAANTVCIENQTTYSGQTSGDVVISSSFEYKDGNTYNVTGIALNAFANTSITSAEIPGTITSWYNTYSGSSTFSGQNFYNCTSLKKVVIGEGITSLPESFCSGCTALEEVSFPEGLKSINENDFNNCSSLETLYLPSTIEHLYGKAFAKCTSLTDIYSYAMESPTYVYSASPTFNGVTLANVTLHIYCDAMESYTTETVTGNNAEQTTNKWTDFNIVTIDTCSEAVTFEPITDNETISLDAGAEGYYSYTATADGTLTFSESGVTVYCYSDEEMTEQIEPTSEDDEVYSIAVTAGATYYFHLVASDDAGTITFTFAEEAEEKYTPAVGDVIVYNKVAYTVNEDVTTVTIAKQSSYSAYDGVDASGEITFPVSFDYKDNTFTVTAMVTGAYQANTNITAVNIEAEITEISNVAFMQCTSLATVILPSTLTTIDGNAFNQCKSISSMTCYAENPPSLVSSSAMQNATTDGAVLYVPCEYIANYTTDEELTTQHLAYYFSVVTGIDGDCSEPAEYTITFDPEKGGTLTLKADDSDQWREFSIICEDGIAFSDTGSSHTWTLRDVEDQVSVSITSFGPNSEGTAIVGKLAQAITTPGKYYLGYTSKGTFYTTIPEGTFLLGPEKVESEEMEYYFTVEFEEAVEPAEYTITFDPEDGKIVEQLDYMTLSCDVGIVLGSSYQDEVIFDVLDEQDKSIGYVYDWDGKFDSENGTKDADGNYTSIKLTLVDDGNYDVATYSEPGTYTITLSDDTPITLANGETVTELELTYTVGETAATADYTLYFDPDGTAMIDGLSKVTISCEGGIALGESEALEWTIYGDDGEMMYNYSLYCCPLFTECVGVDGNYTSLTFVVKYNGDDVELIEPGSYKIKGSLTLTNGEEVSIEKTYEVDGSKVGAEPTTPTLSYEPDMNDDQSSLSTVTITSDVNFSFEEAQTITLDITLSDGDETDYTLVASVDENTTSSITFTVMNGEETETIVKEGYYTIIIPAGTFTFANGYEMADTYVTFTIDGTEAPEETDVAITISPSGETEAFNTITITTAEGRTDMQWDDDYTSGVVVVNNETGTTVAYGESEGDNYDRGTDTCSEIYITLDTTVSEPGEYTITVPAGSIDFNNGGTGDDLTNLEGTSVVTIVKTEEPVESIALTIVPADGAEVKSISEIVITAEGRTDLKWNDDVEVTTVVVYGSDGKVVATGASTADDYNDDDETCTTITVILSTEITAEGNYTISIPESAIYFANDGTPVYSEAATVSVYIPISYTFEPTPGEATDISTITITFNAPITLSSDISADNCYVTSNSTSATVATATSAELSGDGTTLTITLSSTPTEAGIYVFHMAAGFTYGSNKSVSEITANYVIADSSFESGVPEGYYVVPADGSIQESISEIRVYSSDGYQMYRDVAVDDVTYVYNEKGTAVTTVEWGSPDYTNKCAIGTLQLKITDPGTYTISIPDKKLYAQKSASSTTKIYPGPFDVVYTIAGNEEGQGQIEWTEVTLEETYAIEDVSTTGYYHYTATGEGKYIIHYSGLELPRFYSDENMVNELTNYTQTETVEGYTGLALDVTEGDEIYVVISSNAYVGGSLYFTFEETEEYDVTLVRVLPTSDTVELANLYNYEVAVTVDGYDEQGYMSFDIICDGADYHTGYFTYLADADAAAALAEEEGITISVTTFPCYYWQGDSREEAKYETLVEGNTYYFNVTFSESQSSWSTTFVKDETLFTITGSGIEYVYSDYEFSSISPAPSDDEETVDITSVEQNTFTITFTGPVRIVDDESFVNFGTNGGEYPFESITADGTTTTEGEYTYCSSWKLVVSEEVMSMLSGDYEGEDLPLVIAAEDAEGRRVQGNGNGAYLEELTFLNFTYSTDITDGATSSYTITTTPANGAEVTKIDMITFACEDNIDLNNEPAANTVTIVNEDGDTVAVGSAWSDNGTYEEGDDGWTYPTEVYLTIEPTIVAEGYYTINVPASTFVLGDDGYESKEIVISVYVDGSEDEEEYTPAAGDVIVYDKVAYTVNEDVTTVTIAKQSTYSDYKGVDASGEITFPVSFEYKDNTFTVTAMVTGAYQANTNITAVNIEAEITEISNLAFMQCTSLATVILPSTLTTIDGNAFNQCKSISSMTCYAENPPSLSNSSTAMGNATTDDAVLHVPCEYIANYTTEEELTSQHLAYYFLVVTGIDGDCSETADYTLTFDPDGSEELGELSSVTISCEGGIAAIEYTTEYEWPILLDNAETGYTLWAMPGMSETVGEDGNYTSITFVVKYDGNDAKLVAAGTYTISGELTLTNDETVEVNLTYIIDGSEESAEPTEPTLTYEPDTSADQSSLSTVTITSDIAFLFAEDTTLSFDITDYGDATSYTLVAAVEAGETTSITFTVMEDGQAATITKEGNYGVKIPAETFTFNNGTTNEDIVLEYYVDGTEYVAEGVVITISPSGETEAFDTITISAEGHTDVDWNWDDDDFSKVIVVDNNGDTVAYGTDENDNNDYVTCTEVYITLNTMVSTPGEYTIIVPANSLYFTDDYSTNAEGTSVVTIPEAEPDYTLTFDPDGTQDLTSLSSVTISCEGGIKSIAENDGWAITTADGDDTGYILYFMNGISADPTTDTDGNIISFTATVKNTDYIDATITEAGEYVITIPTSTFTFADGSTNEEAITITYVVDGSEVPAATEPELSYNPATGTSNELDSLDKVVITCVDGTFVFAETTELSFNITDYGSDTGYVLYASVEAGEYSELTLTVMKDGAEATLTQEGTYDILIPASTFSYGNGTTQESDINLEYYITGNLYESEGVVITISPSGETEAFDTITITAEGHTDVDWNWDDDDYSKVIVVDNNGDTVAYGTDENDNNDYVTCTEVYITLNTMVSTPGEYTIIVPANSLYFTDDNSYSAEGTSVVTIPEAEPDYTLTFDPVDGAEVEKLDYMTIYCEGGIVLSSSSDEIILNVLDEKGDKTGYVYDWWYTTDKDNGTQDADGNYTSIKLTLLDAVDYTADTITEPGTYTITIPAETFTYADGSTNENIITLTYTVVESGKPEVTVGSIVYDENHVAYEVLNTNGNVAVAKQKETDGKTEGDIDIPEEFEYEGNTYYVTAVDYQAFYNDDITSVTFPGTITDWQGSGTQAGSNVYGCTSCVTVTFKDGITSIPASCVTFDSANQSKITTLYLPSTLESLGSKSFNRLSSLSEVYSYAMTAPTGNASGSTISFNGCNIGSATLYVYCDAKESYEKSDLWKQFGTIATIDDCGGATETPLTTDPAEGDSVESLPYIDVWNPDGILEFDWDDSPYDETDIVVYKDGVQVGACYDYGYDELYDEITDEHYGYRIYFKDDATGTRKYEFVEAGEYKVSFPGQFFMTASDAGVNTYVDAFEVTFTVTGKEVTLDYTLTFDPTGEDAVGHLDEVTISSEAGIDAEKAADLSFAITMDDAETGYYLTFSTGEESGDGVYSSITLVVTDADGNNVTIVEAGDYTVTIPVGAITYADGTTNTEEITVTYSVDGSESSTGGGTGSYTGDVLTPDMSDMNSSSQTTWVWTGPSGAEYHLRARLDNYGDFYIQTNSNSWQLWTEKSGGYIRKVTVVGGTNSNGGTLSLYAQHEPYEVYSFNVPKSPSDLGDTLIESHAIESGETYEFYVTDNYEYFRLYGTSGAYCTVSVFAAEWETPYEVAAGDIVHDGQGVAYKVQEDLTSVYITKQTPDDASYEGCTTGALVIDETIEAVEDGKTYNVTGAETSAFSGASITSIELPGTLAKFGSGSTFYNCTSLESVTLNEGIDCIAGSMFRGCTALTEIDVPEGVTYVDSYAFNGCTSLTTVYLPSTIREGGYDDETIGGSAFAGCSKLTDFTILAPNPPYVGNKAFDSSIISNATLYVPCDYADAYASYSGEYTGWESFGAIVGIDCPEPDYSLTFDPSGENGIGHLSEVVVTTADVALDAEKAADLKWEIIDTESPNAEYYLSFVSGVKDSEGNYSSITLAVTDADGNTTQITEAGTYTVTIKAGDITYANGNTNVDDITLTYTVNGTEWRDTETYNSLCADLSALLEKLEEAYAEAETLETEETVKELYTSIKSEIDDLQATLDADYEAGNTLDADEYNEKIEAIEAEIEHLSAVAYSEYIYYQYAGSITEVWGMVGDYVDWELAEMGDDVYKEFIDDFTTLDSEITSWRKGLMDAAAAGELTDDDKADIEKQLAEYQEAADLLVNKAESYTYYTETTATISGLDETLDTTWAEIQSTYPDAVDLLTSEKEEIAVAITDLQTSLTNSYEAGTLNDEEAQATIDAEIAAIEEAIDNLLNKAHNYEVYVEEEAAADDTSDMLEDTWSEIADLYPDAIDEFEEDYNAIVNAIQALKDQIESNYNDGTILDMEETYAEEIAEIEDMINSLLTRAHLYQVYVDDETEADSTADLLDSTWEEIRDTYGDGAIGALQEDYDEIVSSIDDLKTEIENYYNDGTILDKSDDIAAEIEAIKGAIDQLLENASKYGATGIYSIYSDYEGMDVYTLNGQKINAPTKRGIYIINGKKVYVK